MATYRVKDPHTGRTVKLTGDSPPTESELNDIFSSVQPVQPKPSILKRGYEALAVPERLSRQGLQMISSAVPSAEPTGNLVRDIGLNIPKVAAETMAQVAPSFISRGAILTAGALRGAGAAGKALKPILKGAGRQLESASGGDAGSLEKAYKDSTLIFAKGKEVASPIYEKGKAVVGPMRESLREISDPKKLVDASMKILKKGTLNETEALAARQALDQVKRKVTKDFFSFAREKLDNVAKKAFQEADVAYQRGKTAESLRNILPQNKYGGASAFKMGIAPALTGLGGFVGGPVGAAIGGAMAAGTLSPIVQGSAATAAGIGARAIAPLIQKATSVGPTLSAVSASSPEIKEGVKAIVRSLTKEQAKEFLKEVKKENPDISDEDAKEKVREMAKAKGLAIPKKSK